MIYVLTIILLILVVYYFVDNSKRDAVEVYYSLMERDLKDDNQEIDFENKKINLTLGQKICVVFFSLIIISFSLLFLKVSLENVILSVIFSVSVSYILIRVIAVKEVRNNYKKYDFYLPIVMERLVMAVQGGNDIFSAINVVVKLSKKNGKLDPVTNLLDMVIKKNQSGLSLEDSLKLVASLVNLTSIKHAFLHLGVAQKEGGEVIAPMEELSDSTQEYYQQVIEKEIAIMPVKATLPLLCAFIGLIIFFLSVPLTQILSMKGMP